MPELKFKPWEPPTQKRKTAGPAAAQLSRQRLGPTQDPAQSSHMSQNSVEPVGSGQIQEYHTDISEVDISSIDVALSIPNSDLFVESGAINYGFEPMDITGPSQASSAIVQSGFPYNNVCNTTDRSSIETEDSNGNFGSRAQPIETPISSPEHRNEILAGVEDCPTAADSSIDAVFDSATNGPSLSSGNRAGINAHLKGLSRNASNNTSQSPNKHVSESSINNTLRLERQLWKESLTCNGSTKSHSTDISILSPNCTEQDPVDINGPSSGGNSLTGAPITSPPSENHTPDHLAEVYTNLTSEEYTQDSDCPVPSDYTTSQSGPEPTRTRKRPTPANSCGGRSNGTPRFKRLRHGILPIQSTLRNDTSDRVLRSLPSRTKVHSGKSAFNGANGQPSRSPHASRLPLTDRPGNSVSKKYRAKELSTPNHYRRRGSSTYELPVQLESSTGQKVDYSAHRPPVAHNQYLLGGHHDLNAPYQMHCNLARNESSHPVRMPAKPPSFKNSKPLDMQCNTCGFSAEHILRLSDYVQDRLQEGDNMSTIQLFLGFIRDYAAQRRTYEKPATACNHAHDARVRVYTSDSDHVSTSDTSEHDGGNNTSDTDSSGEDSDNSRSCQSESPNSGVTMSKKRRWEPLEEARLRAWVMEKKEWSWIAKKLRRSPGAVSQHWGFMSKQDVESAGV
ncbi:hypothetical protein F4824DRAFT_154387 [Ustulina deusta]|nr:hypothetical protein F4824DRAFT_154387 [Ustulina deusta]